MKSRPNILVFLTDDHGQWASSCYGNSEIHSPSMEYLARSGAKMTNAFTPCPVCSPARACFFTGKIPSAHGIHDHVAEGGEGRDHPGFKGQTTIAEHLHRAGYHTGLVGKWHLNHFRGKPPGFDQWFTLATGTNAQFRKQPFYEDHREVVRHGNQAHCLTDRALQFLQEREVDRPFFLFVGYTNTHRPHAGEPQRLVGHYRNCSFRDVPHEEMDLRGGFVRRMGPHSDQEKREELAQYYAAVNLIDEQVGRVIDELANMGELANTLIVYTSDHGHMNGHHGLYGKGNAAVPQNFLEESILIPCLLSWPERVGGGQVRDEFVDHCDLFATLLDVAACDAPENADRLPGRSYLPILLGDKPSDWTTDQFCEYGNARMIRTAREKLIRRYPGPNGHFPDEFYDLEADPRETENRIGDERYAEIIAAMDERLEAFFAVFEEESKSGKRIADLPTCNGSEPWTVTEEYFREQFGGG